MFYESLFYEETSTNIQKMVQRILKMFVEIDLKRGKKNKVCI
jgi:hypothetical protein